MRKLTAKGQNKSGGDASHRNRALAGKGQGKARRLGLQFAEYEAPERRGALASSQIGAKQPDIGPHSGGASVSVRALEQRVRSRPDDLTRCRR